MIINNDMQSENNETAISDAFKNLEGLTAVINGMVIKAELGYDAKNPGPYHWTMAGRHLGRDNLGMAHFHSAAEQAVNNIGSTTVADESKHAMMAHLHSDLAVKHAQNGNNNLANEHRNIARSYHHAMYGETSPLIPTSTGKPAVKLSERLTG